MPSWTLGELMSYATMRAGRRSDLALSDMSFWANVAIADLVHDVPQLLSEKTQWYSISSGNSLLSLPADFGEAISFSLQSQVGGSNKTLRQIAPEWADSQGYYPVAEPEGYFLYHDQIQLWPSANSSADTTDASSARSALLRYRVGAPADLTTVGSVPSVATEHRLGILFKLEQYTHDLVGNIEESAAAEFRYTAFVAKLKDAMAKRQAATGRYAVSLPSNIRRRRGGDIRDNTAWLKR